MFRVFTKYFSKTPNKYSFNYEKKDGIYYPAIPLFYKSSSGYKVQTKALVDSGADITIVPKSLGYTMGLTKEKLHYVGGIGGRMGYYLNRVDIEVCEVNVSLPVAWATKDSVPFLLGRKELFRRFKFCFSDKSKSTTVYP